VVTHRRRTARQADPIWKRNQLQKAINKIEPKPFLLKRDIMLRPIIDGFNSPKNPAGLMPNLKIDLGGWRKSIGSITAGPAIPLTVPRAWPRRFRSAQTGGIAPYASHRPTDLTPASFAEIGCTVCHEGQGSSFRISHTPNHPHGGGRVGENQVV
jgi:hypothetical protein